MHKHYGDHGRKNRHFAFADIDEDWEQPRSRRGRAKAGRIRHKPYEKFSRTSRVDWLEDFDADIV